jgi:hypothetical protein
MKEILDCGLAQDATPESLKRLGYQDQMLLGYLGQTGEQSHAGLLGMGLDPQVHFWPESWWPRA